MELERTYLLCVYRSLVPSFVRSGESRSVSHRKPGPWNMCVEEEVVMIRTFSSEPWRERAVANRVGRRSFVK